MTVVSGDIEPTPTRVDQSQSFADRAGSTIEPVAPSKSRWNPSTRTAGARTGYGLVHSVALFACALMAFSGSLKEVPPFSLTSIDLTLLTTLTAFGLGLLFTLLNGSVRMGRAAGVFALLLGMAVAGSITNVPTDFGFEKFIRLFIVTLPAAAAVLLLVRDHIDTYRLIRMFLVISVGLSIFINFGGTRQYGIGRLITEEGTTISFGRAAGFVVIATVAWVISSQRVTVTKLLIVIAIAGFHTWTIFAIASKGPILGFFVAIVAMLLFQLRRLHVRSALRMISLIAILSVAITAVWVRLPDLSRERLVLSNDSSTDVRQQAWDYTWSHLTGSPLGLGWGSWDVLSPIPIQYPHNLFLETWFEAGVIGLLIIIAAVWIPIRNQDRIFKHDRFRATLALGALLYWLTTAMVSGQINDNKVLLMLLVAGAAAIRLPDQSDDADDDAALNPTITSGSRPS